jgi:hypothetical protein
MKMKMKMKMKKLSSLLIASILLFACEKETPQPIDDRCDCKENVWQQNPVNSEWYIVTHGTVHKNDCWRNGDVINSYTTLWFGTEVNNELRLNCE